MGFILAARCRLQAKKKTISSLLLFTKSAAVPTPLSAHDEQPIWSYSMSEIKVHGPRGQRSEIRGQRNELPSALCVALWGLGSLIYLYLLATRRISAGAQMGS